MWYIATSVYVCMTYSGKILVIQWSLHSCLMLFYPFSKKAQSSMVQCHVIVLISSISCTLCHNISLDLDQVNSFLNPYMLLPATCSINLRVCMYSPGQASGSCRCSFFVPPTCMYSIAIGLVNTACTTNWPKLINTLTASCPHALYLPNQHVTI